MLYWAYYQFLGGTPPLFYHPIYEHMYDMNIIEDENPPMFFTSFEYSIVLKNKVGHDDICMHVVCRCMKMG